MIRFNLNTSAADWRAGLVFILFQNISWGWHPGAETCRGLIVVMNCILWFVLYYILLSVFGWCTKCRNMHGTETHNSCFLQFTRFLYIISPCTDYTVTKQIIYPRSLLWRRWHWHLMVDSIYTYILVALTFCKIYTQLYTFWIRILFHSRNSVTMTPWGVTCQGRINTNLKNKRPTWCH